MSSRGSMRVDSAEQLPAHLRAQVPATVKRAARRSKYRNTPTLRLGHKFPSKLEADTYGQLVNLKAVGLIEWFTRQIRFDLPGGVVYRADFLVSLPKPAAGRDACIVIDSTGKLTREKANKLKQMISEYGITVQLAKRKGGRIAWLPWTEEPR
jgi:hypothetical protein